MKTWQKVWLYLIIAFSSLHLFRDLCQDFGIQNFLSTILVKSHRYPVVSKFYWIFFNTYFFEISGILLGFYCLKRNQFEKLGFLTVILAPILLLAWLIYWFIL